MGGSTLSSVYHKAGVEKHVRQCGGETKEEGD